MNITSVPIALGLGSCSKCYVGEVTQVDPGSGSHVDLYPSELQALKAEVRESSDRLVLERLASALPALALVFAGSAASDLVVGHELGRHLAASGSVMAVVSFWMYQSIGTKRIATAKAHQALAAATAMAVANSIAHLYFAASPREIVLLLGVFGLLSYTALSLRWLLTIEGVAIAAWISVAWNSNLFWSWLPLTAVLAAAAAVSVVIVRRRVTRLRADCRKRVIEERLEMQARTERHRKQLRETLAVAGAGDGHWYWDLKTEKTYFSDQWAALLGFEAGELSDNPDEWLKRIHHLYLADVKQALSKHLYGKTERFEIEYRIQHRDGTYLWVLSRGVAARDDDGNPIAIAGSLTDISQLMEIEKRILDDAFHDKLTGLPNRQAFMARLERAVQRSKDFPDSLFAVVFLDLDRFKIINDSLGHLVGDQLLAAGTLEDCYLSLFTGDGVSAPSLFVDQLVHVIVRNILDGIDDPFRSRAGELLFRPQKVMLKDGSVLLADAETYDMYATTGGFGSLGRLIVAAQTPIAQVELDVVTEENAAGYWERDERYDMVLNTTFGQPGLDALCRMFEAWIRHFLDIGVRVQPVETISDEHWVWHVGLDAEGTAILNDLYEAREVDDERLDRILALFRLEFDEPSVVIPSIAGRPVYLAMAMTEDNTLKLKPQNLLVNLPLAEE